MDSAINISGAPSMSSSSLLHVSEYTEGDEAPFGDVDSLPESEPDSDEESDMTLSEETESDADREWKESLQQLEMLLTMVVVPYVGKYFGRRFAYWGWGRFMEWKYPVEIKITDPVLFKGVGAVEAASPL